MKTYFLFLAVFLGSFINVMAATHSFNFENEDGVILICEKSWRPGECVIVGILTLTNTAYIRALNIPKYVNHGDDVYLVTEIAESAFHNLSITSLTLPESILYLRGGCFAGCEDLVSVNLPEGLRTIEGSAFEDCGLTEIYIPESVEVIEESAFSCRNLEKVEFASLSSFFSIDFSSGVTANPLYYGHHLYIAGEEITDITIPEDITELKAYVFNGFSGLHSLRVPATLKQVGRDVFVGCDNLKDVYFEDMESICSIKYNGHPHLLDNVEHLYIGGEEFHEIVFDGGISSIADYAFADYKGLTTVVFGETVTSIGASSFQNCSNLSSVKIGDSMTIIGQNSFKDCSNLESVNLGESLINIGTGSFMNCNKLSSIRFGKSLSYIGTNSFMNCGNLTSVKFGESLKSIGSGSFFGCSNLSSITLPESINWIGDKAFDGCKLRAIQILAPVPPSIGSTSFSGQSTYHTTLYVPQDHFDDYAYDDTFWYRFINIKEFVGESASLNSNTVYTLKDRDAGSFLVYDAVNDCLGSINVDTNIDSNALAHNWQVVRQGNDASLYNLEAKRYLCQQPDGTWGLTSEAQPLSLTDGSFGSIALDGEGEWMFVVNNSLSPSRPEGIETLCEDATISPQQLYDLYGRKATAHSTILIGRDSNGTKKVMVR